MVSYLKRQFLLWSAGVVLGATLVLLMGPTLGDGCLRLGALLVGLRGDHALVTASEARAVVSALAEEAVTARAVKLVPATVQVKR